MGSLQATEAIKLLLGIGEPLAGRLLVYDALSLRFQEFRFTRRADCAVCGDSPSIVSLQEDPVAAIEEWTPQRLATRLAQDDAAPPVLVDVREDYELASGRLPDSLHIPLGQLATRFAEIPASGELVFICAVGMRSMAACRFAAGQGRTAINLAGGMSAWNAQYA
jgi:adenylyltransferase/sulfurtransferase